MITGHSEVSAVSPASEHALRWASQMAVLVSGLSSQEPSSAPTGSNDFRLLRLDNDQRNRRSLCQWYFILLFARQSIDMSCLTLDSVYVAAPYDSRAGEVLLYSQAT